MRRSTCELHFLTRARPKLCGGPPNISLYLAAVYAYSATANLLGGDGGSGTIAFCAEVARTVVWTEIVREFRTSPAERHGDARKEKAGAELLIKYCTIPCLLVLCVKIIFSALED